MVKKKRISDYITQYPRLYFWNTVKKFGLISPDYTIKDQEKDRIGPFDEYLPCEIYGSNSVEEVLITKDHSRIVECSDCGLQYTSPRIKEETWVKYLKSETVRSIEFTENRVKYGRALSSNIKFVRPDWYKERMKREGGVINEIQKYLDGNMESIHDVGCGVGFLLRAAQAREIAATGNELNGYACKVMKQRFGLNVFNDVFYNCPIQEDSLNAVEMNDYIEHTYHPLQDLMAAHKFLRVGGIIRVETFHIDCRTYDQLRGDWNMLFWNHVFHFSTKTIKDLVKRAGFDVKSISTSYDDIFIKVIAQKVI